MCRLRMHLRTGLFPMRLYTGLCPMRLCIGLDPLRLCTRQTTSRLLPVNCMRLTIRVARWRRKFERKIGFVRWDRCYFRFGRFVHMPTRVLLPRRVWLALVLHRYLPKWTPCGVFNTSLVLFILSIGPIGSVRLSLTSLLSMALPANTMVCLSCHFWPGKIDPIIGLCFPRS